MQGRPRQAAHDSALVVAVFLHAREVVLQGLVLFLVVVSEPATPEGQFLVPNVTVLLAELALVLDEIFFFGVIVVEAVPP